MERALRKGRSVASPRVLQFKVTLLEVQPTVWRRFQIPEQYNFWDLHVAIQDVMGWQDYHLHEFRIAQIGSGPPIVVGIPDDEFESGRETLPGWQSPVIRYLTEPGQTATYEYDFGDGWEHEVLLEALALAEEGTVYPYCLSGERACPPEDCGGPYGYAEFLEAIGDPGHPSHKELLEWVGGEFVADRFDPKQVGFDDPKERWEIAFSE
jgi:hypothetical protein